MKTLRWFRKEFFQLVLLALPFIAAALWWNKIPPMVPVHWGIGGQPNGRMPKASGLFVLPVLNIAFCTLMAVVPAIDPRLRRNPQARTPRQRRLWRTWRYAATGFLTLSALMIVAVSAGWRVDVNRFCCTGALALCVVLGNFLGNVEPNYLFGVRTPWTLEDAATWRATHRLAGRWMLFGAVTLLAAGFFVSDLTQVVLLFVYITVLTLGSIGYSAWFFHRRREVS